MMPDPASKLSAFFAELRRRRVVRVAAFYGGIAFVIIQIIDGAFSYLHIPEWFGTAIIILLLVGFPVAMVLAWAFDLTEEGLVRAKPKREPTAAMTARHIVVGNKTLAVIAAVAVAVAVWSWWVRPSATGTITSIAVLPLDNMMGDPEQDYFVEGMHDAIITNLNRLSALKVISRTSAMRYKDTDKLIPEIARELGVDALVEGSVLKAGNRVRITAQLIHGASDEHLWVEDYERDLRDVLTLQGEVARDIARQIKVVLSPVEEARLEAAQPTVNPEAYTAYLQGHHIGWERQGWQMASSLYKTAIALDPGYAPPYADLVASLCVPGLDFDEPLDQQLANIQELSDRAISLDPQLPMAYISLGLFRTIQAQWREAGEAFRQAIAIAPGSRLANVEYGWFLLRAGKVDQALEYMELGLQLDPLSVHSYHSLARAHYYMRQYDQALEVITQGLKLDPDSPFKYTAAIIYLRMGQYEKAIEMFDSWDQVPSHLKGLIHVARGQRGQALQLIEDLKSVEPGEKSVFDDYAVIVIYAILGELDLAMDQLEFVYTIENQRLRLWDWGITYIKVEPDYDPLRDHPRFKALVEDLFDE